MADCNPLIQNNNTQMERLHRISQATLPYLFLLLGLVLPFSVAIENIGVLVFLVLLLFSGISPVQWRELLRNRVVLSLLGFFLLQVVGLLWTRDIGSGVQIIAKHSYLLLVPLFMIAVRKEWVRAYLVVFFVAMAFQSLLSIGMWLHILPPSRLGGVLDPVPFMGHISYNPFLAVAMYVGIYWLLFDASRTLTQKGLITCALLIMLVSMFVTRGRTGQVMFFVMVAITMYQYFEKNRLKAMLWATVLIGFLAAGAVTFSPAFQERTRDAYAEFGDFMRGEREHTDVGLRMAFFENSMEIIREHPLIGVGTGDFNMEYARVDARQPVSLGPTTNPHNMYVLEAVQFGVVGLFSLLWILYAQISFARNSLDPLQRRFGVAFPIMYGVIMLGDSYLRGHFTTMLFVYLSALLYKDWDAGGSSPGCS